MAMRSPPRAHWLGRSTVSAAAVAIAASTALPPERNTSAPSSEARWCGLAIAHPLDAVSDCVVARGMDAPTLPPIGPTNAQGEGNHAASTRGKLVRPNEPAGVGQA